MDAYAFRSLSSLRERWPLGNYHWLRSNACKQRRIIAH